MLVFREPAAGLAVFYRASEALLFALKMVVERTTAADAAALAGISVARAAAMYDAAVAAGLVLCPRGGGGDAAPRPPRPGSEGGAATG